MGQTFDADGGHGVPWLGGGDVLAVELIALVAAGLYRLSPTDCLCG